MTYRFWVQREPFIWDEVQPDVFALKIRHPACNTIHLRERAESQGIAYWSTQDKGFAVSIEGHPGPNPAGLSHPDRNLDLPIGETLTPTGDPSVDHPQHYGGEENPYEAIKVIEAWSLGFCLGNAVKYISRAGKKDSGKLVEDLKKAQWYLDREIHRLEKLPQEKS